MSQDPWTQGVSPEGHPYYFNTVTGESSWTAPPEPSTPLTPSIQTVAWPGGAGTTEVSDLFGPGNDGDSELFGGAGAAVETQFAGATESSSELFSGEGAPGSATFASAPAPAASELFGAAPAPAASELFGAAPAPAASELFGAAPAPAASELFGSTPEAGPGLASAPHDAAHVAHPSDAPVPPTPQLGEGYVAHRVQQLDAPSAAAPAAALSQPSADPAGAEPTPAQGPWIFGYSEQAR